MYLESVLHLYKLLDHLVIDIVFTCLDQDGI